MKVLPNLQLIYVVDRLFEEWQKHPNITIMQEPRTEVFGRTFLVKDPDGHVIRICRRD